MLLPLATSLVRVKHDFKSHILPAGLQRRCAWQQIAKYVYFAWCEAQVSLSLTIRVNTKQIHSIALGKVRVEHNSLETDQNNEKHAKHKYRFVEADVPVIWFQVSLKKDKITVYGDQLG